jgi:hypothetical protein
MKGKESLMQTILRYCLLALLLGAITGCGGGQTRPEGMPPLHRTLVTVTLDGQPVAQATVAFAPADGGRWMATGVTDATGQCQMRTLAEYDGVAAGTYQVSVKKYSDAQMPPELAAIDDPHSPEYVELHEKLQAEGRISEPQPLVPERYLLPGTSGLEVTVTEGENQFPLPLESR